MEITLEVSCCKFPPKSMLSRLWNENKVSLLTFLQQVNKGVRGLIRDQNETPIGNAEIKILGRDVVFRSSKRGEYWRILLPGDYVIQVVANGYVPVQRQFTVVENKTTKLNLYMYPIDEYPAAFFDRRTANLDINNINFVNRLHIDLKLLILSLFICFSFVLV
jgi:hypothetical protein